MDYRLAIPTPDGKRIAGYLEHADYIIVFGIEEDRVAGWEIRDRRDQHRLGIQSLLPLPCIEDCRYLIAGILGDTLQRMCRENDIRCFETEIETVTEVLDAWFKGEFIPELLQEAA
ncbi:hypothetical protein GF324_08300 [bacterium]|nr:hypothetical protein [bacterium]